MEDLFGHVPQQRDLFAASDVAATDTLPISAPIKHTPDTIRAEMHRLLAEVRSASAIPWPARELQSHRAMFPYMAEWLKGGEGDQLRLEFRAELERLRA